MPPLPAAFPLPKMVQTRDEHPRKPRPLTCSIFSCKLTSTMEEKVCCSLPYLHKYRVERNLFYDGPHEADGTNQTGHPYSNPRVSCHHEAARRRPGEPI